MSSAVRGELKPCARCGAARWFHLLTPPARRAADWRDDGHSFDAGGRAPKSQLKLVFIRPELERERKRA